jgi:cysteine-rich repeat protein
MLRLPVLAAVLVFALGIGAGTSEAAVFVAGPEIQVSGPTPFATCTADEVPDAALDSEVEPWLVVNPTDPNHLVGIWQQDRSVRQSPPSGSSLGNVAGVSFDAGQSWQPVVIPKLSECSGGTFDYASDPWLTFAPNGDLYFIGVSWDLPPSNIDSEYVSKSLDGGLSWSDPVSLWEGLSPTAISEKPTITAHPNDSRFVYAVWYVCEGSCALSGLSHLFFRRTTDGGATWEPQTVLYDPVAGSVHAAQIVVLPQGTLVALMTEVQFDLGIHLALKYSEDRGVTWLPAGDPIRAAAMQPAEAFEPDTGIEVGGAGSFGQFADFAVDRVSGNLYAVWQDGRNGGVSQVAFVMSTDRGLTWSAPAFIAGTPPSATPLLTQSFVPQVAVADDGTVAVTYYDFRHDTPSAPPALTDYWFAYCDPGWADCTNPVSWREVRLTQDSFDTLQALRQITRYFLGDYMGLTSTGGDFLSLFVRSSAADPGNAHFVRVFQTPFCGDSIIDSGEECDDGNTTDGDGCSGICQVEQLQDEDQQKCINELNKNFAKVAKAQGKVIDKCLKDGAKDKLENQTIEECSTADNDGKVANAKQKTITKASGKCSVPPDFGPTDPNTVNRVAIDKELGLIHDIFGSDLDTAILPQSGLTSDQSKCQLAVAKAAKKCQDAKLKVFNKCKKDGLKSKTVPPGVVLPVDTAGDLEQCMGFDPKGKTEKACDPTTGKIRSTIDKKCGGVDFPGTFPELLTIPGCGTNDHEAVAACVDQIVECQVCLALNQVDGLSRDCDLFDDGTPNASCAFGSFLALTYNVAGLPDPLSDSTPSIFTPIISPLLNGYDLVLVQESWQTPDPNPLAPLRVYHELLVADAHHPYKSEPAPLPVGNDPNRPSALVSDGLNRFSQFHFDPVVREAWTSCFGVSDNGADCLAFKGFSVARTTLAAGVMVDIYNLHMEAGNAPEDVQVRDESVTQLSAFLNAFSVGEAVIMGGDFNLNSDTEPAASQFQTLLSNTGLTDVCAFLACPEPGRIDKFLFRSSDTLTLTPTSWNFETDVFVTDDDQPLSDHDALAVRFDWAVAPPAP